MSHKIVRDDKGRAVTLVVDESRRRLLDDLAAVFLEGYAFEEVEKQLYERFGHINQRTGKRFAASMTRKLLYNPYFWGHAALGHNGKASGAWVYDLDLEPPPDVTIYRNTHPPAYTGDLALRIQATSPCVYRRKCGDVKAFGVTHSPAASTPFLDCSTATNAGECSASNRLQAAMLIGTVARLPAGNTITPCLTAHRHECCTIAMFANT
jgi:hypothetical protein